MKKIFLILREGLDLGPSFVPFMKFIHENFELTDNSEDADYHMVLGGDGTMIKAVRQFWEPILSDNDWPKFFGINFGHVGFLLNDPEVEVLKELAEDKIHLIHARLLHARLFGKNGDLVSTEYALNDFYFERSSKETAKIRVTVNGVVYRQRLICDGMIVASPVGSTAYNAAARGPILPIEANTMVLTGICPAIYANWHNAILPPDATVVLEVLETDRNPVRFLAEGVEVPNIIRAEIKLSEERAVLVFAQSQDFGRKNLRLQLREPIKE
jgi:NAD+ kinase